MHPITTSERPSPAIAAPASSPAPADAGQGVGTIHCAQCNSSDLEQYCHMAPDPIYGCRCCGAQLNADGSVCGDQVEGTGFDRYLERKREALRVLKEMFHREKSGSPEYEALLDAIASLTMILEDAGRA